MCQCQRNKFEGKTIGPKPQQKSSPRKFSLETIIKGREILMPQSGSNQFASQKGMAMGGVRHAGDILVDDQTVESHTFINHQSGLNVYESQCGMRPMGGSRDINHSVNMAGLHGYDAKGNMKFD